MEWPVPIIPENVRFRNIVTDYDRACVCVLLRVEQSCVAAPAFMLARKQGYKMYSIA